MVNYTLKSIGSRYIENKAKYGGAMYIYGNSLSYNVKNNNEFRENKAKFSMDNIFSNEYVIFINDTTMGK